MKLHKDSNSYKILKYVLLAGGFLAVASMAPTGGAQIVQNFTREYFRKKKFERSRFLRDLRRLQSRELIDYKEKTNGNVEIVLTKSGKKKILEYNIDDLKLNKEKKWDGKWRMIMFDIPNSKKKIRDILRQKLKLLEFYPIQKSVFISPYECEKEIDFISSFYNVGNNILLFHTHDFEGEEKLKHYFKLN